ncbi:hypothetical protein F5Y16DRAFT_98134 [Xylariaceae sp. FL0255]|nr:hypothetical protein F5Y16DRAFT_98134 [Xylariaceae sp. FL0255]
MEARYSSASVGLQSDSLFGLLDNAEAKLPLRFREHGWYLTVIGSLNRSGQKKLAGRLYEHLVAQPQYQTSTERQALIRRMREAMVKCIILNGIPSVIEAIMAISAVEWPEDQDHSCLREGWQIGSANTESSQARGDELVGEEVIEAHQSCYRGF